LTMAARQASEAAKDQPAREERRMLTALPWSKQDRGTVGDLEFMERVPRRGRMGEGEGP